MLPANPGKHIQQLLARECAWPSFRMDAQGLHVDVVRLPIAKILAPQPPSEMQKLMGVIAMPYERHCLQVCKEVEERNPGVSLKKLQNYFTGDPQGEAKSDRIDELRETLKKTSGRAARRELKRDLNRTVGEALSLSARDKGARMQEIVDALSVREGDKEALREAVQTHVVIEEFHDILPAYVNLHRFLNNVAKIPSDGRFSMLETTAMIAEGAHRNMRRCREKLPELEEFCVKEGPYQGAYEGVKLAHNTLKEIFESIDSLIGPIAKKGREGRGPSGP